MGKSVQVKCIKCGHLFSIPLRLKEAYCVHCGLKQFVKPSRTGNRRDVCAICGAPAEAECTYCKVSLCAVHTLNTNPKVGILTCCKECAHTKLYVANLVNVRE